MRNAGRVRHQPEWLVCLYCLLNFRCHPERRAFLRSRRNACSRRTMQVRFIPRTLWGILPTLRMRSLVEYISTLCIAEMQRSFDCVRSSPGELRNFAQDDRPPLLCQRLLHIRQRITHYCHGSGVLAQFLRNDFVKRIGSSVVIGEICERVLP